MSHQEHEAEQMGIVFIHGVGLTGRVWSRVAEGLDYPCLLADAPLRSETAESRKELSLEDYTTHLKKQIEAWGIKSYVIVAHSLGGVLALKLASELGDGLKGFVAVGAAIPKNGGSFVSALPFLKRMVMTAILRKLGTKPPDSAIRAGLCNDLTPEQTGELVRGFLPESVFVYTQRSDALVPDVPKLYIKLMKDKEFSPSFQNKMAANLAAHNVVSLNTGHLPMLSDPQGLRLLLQEFALRIAKTV